jgi:hypothetical protein
MLLIHYSIHLSSEQSLIDRVKGQSHRDDDDEPRENRRSGTKENKEPGDRLNTWKKSLTDFIAPKDD